MRPTLFRLAAAGLALILVPAAAPLTADWLVTRDGYRMETDGAWSVDGELVIFRLAGGALSSIPADEIDLEASHRLTKGEAGGRQAEETREPAQERQARWVITDEDVTHVARAVEAAPAEEGEETAPEAGVEAAAGSLTVTSWERRDVASPAGLEIRGTLRNGGGFLAASITLTVTLRTPDGDELGSAPAALDRQSLAPDRDTGFRVLFPDVYDFDTVEFEPRSVALEFGSGEPPDGEL